MLFNTICEFQIKFQIKSTENYVSRSQANNYDCPLGVLLRALLERGVLLSGPNTSSSVFQ